MILINCFTVLLILALVLTATLYVGAPALLRLFGASDATLPYALQYGRIYILGSVFVLIALFASFVVTRLMWMKMANVAAQKGAARYQTADGLMLTKQVDQFLTQTVRRRKIERSDSGSGKSGSSRAHSGGGGSGRSGKF